MFTGAKEAGRKWQHGVPGRHLQLPDQIQWGRQTVQEVGDRAESHEHVHRSQDVWPGQGRLMASHGENIVFTPSYIFLSFFICDSESVKKKDWEVIFKRNALIFKKKYGHNNWPHFTNDLKLMLFWIYILIRCNKHKFEIKPQI